MGAGDRSKALSFLHLGGDELKAKEIYIWPSSLF